MAPIITTGRMIYILVIIIIIHILITLIIHITPLILIIILSINIFVLLNTLDNSYTDGWNLRQAQTAIMTRNIFFDNFNIFPTRLTFFAPFEGKVILEFPIIHLLTAASYKFFSISEINGRILYLKSYLLCQKV